MSRRPLSRSQAGGRSGPPSVSCESCRLNWISLNRVWRTGPGWHSCMLQSWSASLALQDTIGAWTRAGALGLVLAVLGPAPGAGTAPRGSTEGALAGKLLVAAPGMTDPRFSRAVIYIVLHNASGAVGLIVNRPFKEVSIASLLDRMGLEHEKVRGSLRIHYGGPVGPGSVFVLHTADYRVHGTKVIGNGIALTTTPDVLRAIGSRAGPRRALLVLSYSGWAPGQLELEIHAGAWVVAPSDPALIFDDNCETKWERAMARRELDL